MSKRKKRVKSKGDSATPEKPVHAAEDDASESHEATSKRSLKTKSSFWRHPLTITMIPASAVVVAALIMILPSILKPSGDGDAPTSCRDVEEAIKQAEALKREGSLPSALERYQEAGWMARDAGEPCPLREVRALLGQADCYRLMGQLDEGKDLYNRVIDFAKHVDKQAGSERAYANRGLGEIYATDPERAREAADRFTEAETYFRSAGDETGVALIYLGKARMYYHAGKWVRARAELDRIDRRLAGRLDETRRAHYYCFKADVLFRVTRQLNDSIDLLGRAIILLEDHPNEILETTVRLHLINYLLEARDTAGLEEQFRQLRNPDRNTFPVPYFKRLLLNGKYNILEGKVDAAMRILRDGYREIGEQEESEAYEPDQAKLRPIRYEMQVELANSYLLHAGALTSKRPDNWHYRARKALQEGEGLTERLMQDIEPDEPEYAEIREKAEEIGRLCRQAQQELDGMVTHEGATTTS